MERIFLKNYKGFKHQVVNLDEMNFLVGENSTGKTSFLKVINLLSSSEFWYTYEFNNNEVELGYFDEIINKQTTDKFFQLGIEKSILIDDDGNKGIFRVIFEFHESNSIPTLKQIKVNIDENDVLVKFTKKQISYRLKYKNDSSFNEWATDFDFPKNYKVLSIPRNLLPVSILIHLIEREIQKNKNSFTTRRSFGNELLYSNYKWLAPIRAKAKRTYESYKIKFSPEGEHIPSILRQILSSKSNREKNKIIKALESFGKDSNLFDKIEVRELGKKNSSPFEIIIKYENIEIKLPNVGYGVSQSLPLIIEILSSKNTCFSIQQPEVHLHPKAQSAFGSFLFNAVKNDTNKFIIETHSDFTINRFRYKLHSSKEEIDFSSKVLFFERTGEGNKITTIDIKKNGSYAKKVPTNYRDFFIDEELKLLEL
ncbi:Predicted ATPase [Flagellimonas taeanensis]|uniref:Predicted ATPase n=1 Tax=Flagellimonas taeanensis TaxID=1005926 RepID=A0A1M6W5Z6_9FLAO|nr:AAA family ATPase [Allomuricauda taeanensis]SFC46043.1 Predicted ATPase [Allomuricauda taeanensis]SHK89099.1 Predicted ATPase [Allomuricauda taeanensis]